MNRNVGLLQRLRRAAWKLGMFGRWLAAALVIAGVLLGTLAGGVAAERRVALVIGNSKYNDSNLKLANPLNDASDIAKVLRSLDFQTVEVSDASKRDMERALEQFAQVASSADSALFYYAGHAMQFQGRNYLMPVDAKLENEFSVRYQMVSTDDIRDALDRANGVKIMILDSCRNNPLAERLRTQMLGQRRNIGNVRGLARIDAAQGMVVAYATGADQVAIDGSGRNSPFTTALLTRLQEPGLEIGIMFRQITQDVYESTNGRQRPATYTDLITPYYLNQSDRLAWERIKDSTDPNAFSEFIRRFPSSPHALTARSRMDMFSRFARERQETEALLAKLAEERRLLEEATRRRQQADEEARRQEAGRKRAEEEAARQREAEERARIAAEQERREREAALQREQERLAALAAAERRRREEEAAKQGEAEERAKAIAEQERLEREAEAGREQERRAAQAAAERRRAEQEAARKREEEERAKAAAEQARRDQEIAKRREQERLAAQAEAERRRAEQEAARLREVEERAKATAERERKEREAAARREAEEQAKVAAERARKEQEAARIRAQEEEALREAAAKMRAEREAARQREAEEQRAKVAAEEARREQEIAKRREAEEQAKLAAERARQEQDAAQRREQQARLTAEREAAERREAEEAAKQAAAAASQPAAEATTPQSAEPPAQSSAVAVAALTTPPVQQKALPELPSNTPELVRAAQKELRRLGCFSGRDSGSLNEQTQDAVRKFLAGRGARTANVAITDEFVSDLKAVRRRACVPDRPVASRPPAKQPAPAPAARVRRQPAEAAASARPAPRPARPAPAPAATPRASQPSRPMIGIGF